MNNGIFGEGFPYSNFHDLNMDWIIKIAKDFLDQYTHIQDVINTGLTDLDNKTNSGLTELNNKAIELQAALDAWYQEHSVDIANALTEAVQNFYTEANRIGAEVIATIPEDYSVLDANVKQFNRYDVTSPFKIEEEQTLNGVTMSVTGNIISLSGTCTASGAINFVNSTLVDANIKTETNYYVYYEINRLPNMIIQIYTSTDNGSNYTFYRNVFPHRLAIVNFPAATTNVIIRVSLESNVNYSGTDIVFGLLTHYPITDDKTAYIEASTMYTTQTLMTTLSNLITAGYNIKFGKGTFNFDSQLTLIDGTIIEGEGFDTILNFTGSGNFIYNETGNVIIRNLTIKGLSNDRPTTYFPATSQTGIYLTHEHGKPITIDSVQLFGLTKNGIAADDLGYSNTRGINIINCTMLACGAGISFGQQAEYNNITNCNFRSNYYGVVNNAGNNKFVCCGFNSNVIGLFMQHTYNDAHSSISNCTFNHNATHGIQLSGLTGAMTFSGCTIFLSHSEGEPNDILIYSSKGVVFDGCLFGRNCGIAVNVQTGQGLTLFTSCMFENSPTFTKINAPDIIMNNCYTNEGTVVTAN